RSSKRSKSIFNLIIPGACHRIALCYSALDAESRKFVSFGFLSQDTSQDPEFGEFALSQE
ncbi:MAG TPA: hypothetical protein VGB16_01940, partial [candidate division Zixibacteria bacterium]